MTSRSKIGKLDNKYNNTYHRAINPNKVGLLRVVFSGGRVNLTANLPLPPPLFIFQEELI